MIEGINDTIAAISTPIGKGAVAIVRVSGNRSIEIVDSLFKGKKNIKDLKANTITYGKIIDDNMQTVDEVLVSIFRAPHSFTGEDVIEINCHGGIIPNRILDIIIKKGARLAYPGEFTKRAFFNGKIDITQAEAINDIINSTTLSGASLAIKNLNKALSKKIADIRNKLLDVFAKTEVMINYPEEEISFEKGDKDKIEYTINEIKKILETPSSEKVFKGFKVVIAGRTNVGKSSLLNLLAGEEKAIVSHIHGTTRDIIEVEINIENIPIILIDTAGIREEYENEIEGYGIIKAKENINKSDLVLFVFEADNGLTEDDKKILKKIKKNTILVGNKADRGIKENNINAVYISVKENKNINTLLEKIKEKLELKNIETTEFYINKRQRDIIEKLFYKLVELYKIFLEEDKLDIISVLLQEAIKSLDTITGQDLNKDLFDNIFSNFCVGK